MKAVLRLAGVVTATSLLTLASCAKDTADYHDAPGTNVDVDGVLVRYARLQPPADPQGWQIGDDVPLYLTLDNQTGTPVSLVGVTSVVAEDVALSSGALPVDLPQGQLVSLERDGRHLVLRHISQQIRGAEFIEVTVTFSGGRTASMNVEAVAPNPTGPDLPNT